KAVFDVGKATSPNVVAILRGSDAQLQDEFVLISAHLDHIGPGVPVNGDNVYNGAMDNASGVAALFGGRASPPIFRSYETLCSISRLYGRGGGPQRLRVFRRKADCQPKQDNCRHQFRYVLAALSPENCSRIRPA